MVLANLYVMRVSTVLEHASVSYPVVENLGTHSIDRPSRCVLNCRTKRRAEAGTSLMGIVLAIAEILLPDYCPT